MATPGVGSDGTKIDRFRPSRLPGIPSHDNLLKALSVQSPVTARPWTGAPILHLPAERPNHRSDDETIEVTLAQSGDGHAFERLYRQHVTRVHSLVRRMVPDDDAEELTQDVFVRA
jgi:hypothetical protein